LDGRDGTTTFKSHRRQVLSNETQFVEMIRRVKKQDEHEIPFRHRAVAYYYKGEYDKAWQDVNKAQELGHRGDPALLDALRKATRKSSPL
jgi:hypothetical protein